MSKIIDKHLKRVESDHSLVDSWAGDFLVRLDQFLSWSKERRHDAATWGGYAIMLLTKHYPEEMEFTISVEERESFIAMIEEKTFYFNQENHDDGSITVKIVFDEKDKNVS